MSSDPSLLEFLKNNPTMFQNYQAIVIKTLLESTGFKINHTWLDDNTHFSLTLVSKN